MSKVNIKLLSEDALIYLRNNAESFAEKIKENSDNSWIENTIPTPIFIDKKMQIDDFELLDNPSSKDKEKDFKNSITIYENLKNLPRYILCDQRFWLWLHLDKYYEIVRNMMQVSGTSTFKDHWLHEQGTRRGLMFGVLSRCFFRVELTVIPNENDNKYELTRWIIENPERFRNLSWRSFSSEKHLVRGILQGEKRAVSEIGKEDNKIYPKIAKDVSIIGSARLLDCISEEDIENMVYKKMLEYMCNGEDKR